MRGKSDVKVLKLDVVMVSQPFGPTKNHFIVDLQWINCVAHEFMALWSCFVLKKNNVFSPSRGFCPTGGQGDSDVRDHVNAPHDNGGGAHGRGQVCGH